APRPPYAPASVERNTSVCAARTAAWIGVAGLAYARASSIRAAVPDALSFAPGPVPRSSRCAMTTIASCDLPRATAQVLQSHAPETRHRLRPRVARSRELERPQLCREPPCRSACAARPRPPVREVGRERGREARRRLRVEHGRQQRRRKRGRLPDRERREEE